MNGPKPIPGYKEYSFNCVGSVGYGFQTILVDVVQKYGMQTGKFLRAPIERLVHNEN
jgi:hypothetical protein